MIICIVFFVCGCTFLGAINVSVPDTFTNVHTEINIKSCLVSMDDELETVSETTLYEIFFSQLYKTGENNV